MRTAWLVACVLAACGGGGSTKVSDMAARPDMSMPDMAVSGAIGDPCTSTSQCTVGKAPVCWTQTLLNMSGYLATTGGLCSSACNTNADCGAQGGVCVGLGTDGRYCMRACSGASDCRDGYACFMAGGGNCYPSENLSCDPTAGIGTCTGSTPEPGACERLAYGTGKTGECYDGCRPGVGTCSTQNGVTRQCSVVDYATDKYGDKFVGPVCIEAYSKNAIGEACLYQGNNNITACVDGAACYLSQLSTGGDNKCHQLCTPGTGGVACATGTCTDVWNIFSSSNPAGLCL